MHVTVIDLSCSSSLLCSLFTASFPSPEKRLSGILDVLLGIAQGCQYIHARGIIHGDLKPDNVRAWERADYIRHGLVWIGSYPLWSLPSGVRVICFMLAG